MSARVEELKVQWGDKKELQNLENVRERPRSKSVPAIPSLDLSVVRRGSADQPSSPLAINSLRARSIESDAEV